MRLTVTAADPHHDVWSAPALLSAWSTLLAADPEASSFATPGWLRAWWETLGSGRLLLVTVFDGAEVVALFPMCQAAAATAPEMLGDEDVCDEPVWLARPGAEAAALTCLAAWAFDAPRAQTLVLTPLRTSSRWHGAASAAALELGLGLTSEPRDVAPAIALPATCDTYLARLPRHDRHELVRKRRRLAALGPLALVRARGPGLSRALADFVAHHRSAPGDKGAFFTPARERFFERLAALEGARLDVLTLAGGPIAWALGFVHAGRYGLYNTSFDRAFAAASPGVVMLGALIAGAIAEGLATFDFLRGGEAYKRRFAPTVHPLQRLTLTRAA